MGIEPQERGQSSTASQIQQLDKDVVSLSLVRDALQFQRVIYNLCNLLEQRNLAIKQKQIAGDKYREDYEQYIEKVNDDIKKLLAL